MHYEYFIQQYTHSVRRWSLNILRVPVGVVLDSYRRMSCYFIRWEIKVCTVKRRERIIACLAYSMIIDVCYFQDHLYNTIIGNYINYITFYTRIIKWSYPLIKITARVCQTRMIFCPVLIAVGIRITIPFSKNIHDYEFHVWHNWCTLREQFWKKYVTFFSVYLISTEILNHGNSAVMQDKTYHFRPSIILIGEI